MTFEKTELERSGSFFLMQLPFCVLLTKSLLPIFWKEGTSQSTNTNEHICLRKTGPVKTCLLVPLKYQSPLVTLAQANVSGLIYFLNHTKHKEHTDFPASSRSCFQKAPMAYKLFFLISVFFNCLFFLFNSWIQTTLKRKENFLKSGITLSISNTWFIKTFNTTLPIGLPSAELTNTLWWINKKLGKLM